MMYCSNFAEKRAAKIEILCFQRWRSRWSVKIPRHLSLTHFQKWRELSRLATEGGGAGAWKAGRRRLAARGAGHEHWTGIWRRSRRGRVGSDWHGAPYCSCYRTNGSPDECLMSQHSNRPPLPPRSADRGGILSIHWLYPRPRRSTLESTSLVT